MFVPNFFAILLELNLFPSIEIKSLELRTRPQRMAGAPSNSSFCYTREVPVKNEPNQLSSLAAIHARNSYLCPSTHSNASNSPVG